MAESWTILYKNALQAAPLYLVDTIKSASDAMHARLRTLLLGSEPNCQSERRALYLGLADLYVLRVSYQASQAVNLLNRGCARETGRCSTLKKSI